ncbi:hypothetical protein DL93DRAFT_2098795 [Clavulina sp. PMI_390]|nr:hypothetical protein DL93DRAFT_2098795 [Clavulina sp. PMI_390]
MVLFCAFRSRFVRTLTSPVSSNRLVEIVIKIRGFGTFPNSIDPRTNTRSFSALGYLIHAPPRPNLKVLINATARRVLLDSPAEESMVEARGVEFNYDGEVYTVRAKRDVILSAGALRSCALLELSGIGNKEIIEPLGIKTLVHNPAVGENTQEHILNAACWETKTKEFGLETLDLLADPAVAGKHFELYKEGRGLFITQINSIIWLHLADIVPPERFAQLIAAEEAKIAEDLKDPAKNRPGLSEQYALQMKALKDSKAVNGELTLAPMCYPSPNYQPEPGRTYFTLVATVNLPFSRGSIHIKSSDPDDATDINPNLFDHDLDREILVELHKWSRKLATTSPFKDIIVQELAPGPVVKTDDDLRGKIIPDGYRMDQVCSANSLALALINANVEAMSHTVGSCSMAPRDKGGVVDASLKVYGTKNLRVCDLSIIPLHISGHMQATAYAIGEQLADILRAERDLSA